MSKNRTRFTEIVNTFARYGFGEIYNRGLGRQTDEEGAESLRRSFEELGPSFIKIGQTLATRNDVLPEAYILELKKLQTASPSFSFEEADQIFFDEHGLHLEEAFLEVKHEPLATGSIAQVHYGITEDHQEVAIKIQRPYIKEELIRDLNLFMRFIELIPIAFQGIIVDPIQMVRELRESSLRELNFYDEAQSMLHFQELNKDRTLIQLPQLFLEYSSERILIMEYIEGIDITDITTLNKEGYQPSQIAERLVQATLYQVFEDGYYHGDPHPGNILISNNKIYYLDFGIIGTLTDTQKSLLYQVLKALVMKDIDQLTHLVMIICHAHGVVNEKALHRDIRTLYNRYLTAGFYSIDLQEMFQDLLRLALKHQLTFPNTYILLIKTIILVQGTAQELDPDMDFMAILTEFGLNTQKSFLAKDLAPHKMAREAGRSFITLLGLSHKVDQTLDDLNNDRITVNIDFRNSKNISTFINQIVNRMTIALLLAAVIISSGLLATNANARTANIGLFFFVIGIIFAIYLLLSFIRSRWK
ncbi:AarF/ABC1/UbiB kinase family protein [Aerococcaceae bacterium DSM 111020]|nr:AarF/ABC1/UbiB kinase family protein [Aerococcaceae bacterium DSM 111020]